MSTHPTNGLPLADKAVELAANRGAPLLDGLTYGLKIVNRDLTSQFGYRYPWPGHWTAPVEPDGSTDPCGPGYHVMRTWEASRWAVGSSGTALLVGWDGDPLAGAASKARYRSVYVADVVDVWALIRRHGADADLGGADLGGANLRDANLRDANLGDADLGGADLRGANLGGADLRGANLRGAYVGGADLRGAYVGGADLRDADLSDANLSGADLTDANLRYANLWGANLTDANLRWADLTGANLSDANLSDANLSGANLTDARNVPDHAQRT